MDRRSTEGNTQIYDSFEQYEKKRIDDIRKKNMQFEQQLSKNSKRSGSQLRHASIKSDEKESELSRADKASSSKLMMDVR